MIYNKESLRDRRPGVLPVSWCSSFDWVIHTGWNQILDLHSVIDLGDPPTFAQKQLQIQTIASPTTKLHANCVSPHEASLVSVKRDMPTGMKQPHISPSGANPFQPLLDLPHP